MGTMPAGEVATSHESGKLALSLDVVVVTAEACFKTVMVRRSCRAC